LSHPAADLAAALDETNTRIEVQRTLQTMTGGMLHDG
jgi:hypothetical protein